MFYSPRICLMSPIFMKFYRINYAVIYSMFTKKSSSLAVKGELGVYLISINIYINIMKFFYHLGDLSRKGNYLISNCLYECYKDLYSADSSVNKNWLKAVIYLFESNDFQFSNLSDYLELDQQTVLRKVKQNLCKIY